ncbi:VQ motif-containing protein 9-like [Rutidosis leptorrhynchoides]|uniref:VQ motif-containing protein 9-like n=1 Tax=Rutidosis leptorrhynchoides TaxID=125765 RepID=UPI003A999C36
MDKGCHSSGQQESSPINPITNPNPNLDSSTTAATTNNNKDHYLQINKFSHKISKPPIKKPFEFDPQNHHHPHHHHQIPHHQPPLILDQPNESQPSNLHYNHHQQQQQQHQPPVYNVSKSDFRDVVQKLTGSPAHERLPSNPVQPVKPQSSRLQRIRPPPLEHIGNRPPAAASSAAIPNFRPAIGNFFAGQRPHHQPLSPLPPLPAVHATAESPISAYMRCFQTNVTGFNQVLPQGPDFPAPSSPLPFGCLPPMLSPGHPFSPTNQFGFQQLTPLSSAPPAPSPR